MSAIDMANLIAGRQASPRECAEAVLERIATWEPHLHAFVDLDAEAALEQADEATRAVTAGAELGPLHGVPVTIKNLQAVAGYPTRRGSRLTPDTPAAADAPLVARLRDAGAVVVGTTTMPEQGWTATSDSPLTGPTINPWGLGLTSGGSSAGAGALAGAGCGPLHVGTDGAGSIRVPAHFCGAVGFKPTYGRVPYTPVPNNAHLSHAGPITRTVADAALITAVMAGPDPLDLVSLPGSIPAGIEPGGLSGLRIAYSPDLGHARVDPEVAGLVRSAVDALAEAGAHIEEVTPAWGVDGPSLIRAMWGLSVLNALPADDTVAAQMDPALVACARDFAEMTALEAVRATGRRLAYAAAVNTWFGEQGWDLLVTPSASVAAFEVGRMQPAHWPQHPWDWISWAEFSYPFNLSHGPAISVPCGLTAAGLPVGLQLAGPRLADGLVLRAAAGFLECRPFEVLPAPPAVP
ncbi:MAG: hypothetical protein KGP12_02625 [Actinomycetales bacterium]|nr:hypothetical protein [Actinomycetales bacterium]